MAEAVSGIHNGANARQPCCDCTIVMNPNIVGVYDVSVEASGAVATGPAAIAAVRKGGRTVLVGLPVAPTTINFLSVVGTEKEIIGSLSHVYDEDFATAVQFLADGRVRPGPLISDRIPLDDVVTRGLHRLEDQASSSLKILVEP